MRLDPVRFPATAQYLGAIPMGFDAFPECEVSADAVEPFVRGYSRLASEPGVPRPVAELLGGRLEGKKWVSGVAFQASNLVIRDLAFKSDAAFHKWTHDSSREIFDKPFVRHLMRLVSPTLIIAGATKRWATFHRGSDLKTLALEESNGRLITTAVLRYPQGIFPRLFLEGLEHAFLAAVTGSRGKEVRVELTSVTVGKAEYRVSYLK